MRRHEPCAHLRPDYDRLEEAHYIRRDPDTYEISWPPTGLRNELQRLGLIDRATTLDKLSPPVRGGGA